MSPQWNTQPIFFFPKIHSLVTSRYQLCSFFFIVSSFSCLVSMSLFSVKHSSILSSTITEWQANKWQPYLLTKVLHWNTNKSSEHSTCCLIDQPKPKCKFYIPIKMPTKQCLKTVCDWTVMWFFKSWPFGRQASFLDTISIQILINDYIARSVKFFHVNFCCEKLYKRDVRLITQHFS